MTYFNSNIFFADGTVGIDPAAGLDFDSARQATPRFWGVSYGNGNDGVSHSFPDFIVRAADPWTVAPAATLDTIAGRWWDWALGEMDTDGEPEFTISTTLYEGPDGETQFGAAWFICEVFEVDGPAQYDCQYHDSLEAAFSKEALAKLYAFAGEAERADALFA